MMLKKILSMGLALAFCGLASAGCAKGDSENKRTPITLPDYENMQSEPLMINGWLSPPPTTDAYREYKGNKIFISNLLVTSKTTQDFIVFLSIIKLFKIHCILIRIYQYYHDI